MFALKTTRLLQMSVCGETQTGFQNLNSRLKQKVKSFIAFSIVSTHITDVAQLAIFSRGVDDMLTVTEEFVVGADDRYNVSS